MVKHTLKYKLRVACRFLFFIAAAFLLSEAKGQGKTSLNKQDLVGRWISSEDKQYEVVFTTREKLEYYNNELQSSATYKVQNDSLVTKDKSDQSTYYYSIVGLDKKHLTLIYLERGNLLKFYRKP